MAGGEESPMLELEGMSAVRESITLLWNVIRIAVDTQIAIGVNTAVNVGRASYPKGRCSVMNPQWTPAW